MAGSVNRATILGRLGRDPEARTTQNGTKVTTLSVATSESWKDANGEKQERTEWHRVVLWGGPKSDGLAGIAEKYLRKGSQVYLSGKLETRKWTDQQGTEKYTTEIVLRGFSAEMVLLDGKGEGGGSDYRGGGGGGGGDHQRESPGGGDQGPAWDSGGRDLDDEIPF